MYAYLRDNSLDLLTFGKDSLLLANTFSFKDPMDAVYYILACRQSLKLDETNNELFLTGNNSIREIKSDYLLAIFKNNHLICKRDYKQSMNLHKYN